MTAPHFDIQMFYLEGTQFLQSLTSELASIGIDVQSLPCDHLCYRVATQSEYEEVRGHLFRHGQLLTEAPVNGRPISTFKLKEPIQARPRQVELVELPAPKPGTSYATGFEHAEFVIKEGFDAFQGRHLGVRFEKWIPRVLNPELTVKLSNKQAKFHHHSLERIIEIENATFRDLIFDFDGTLIQSRETIYEINRLVFSEILNREIGLAESQHKFHPEFTRLFEAFGITDSHQKKTAIQRWGEVSDRFTYKFFDGIFDLLLDLYRAGYALHLWTARDEASARKILGQHQIEDLFSTLSFANDLRSKPHPESLQFDWRSTSLKNTLVIGDSPTDIRGAQAIGAYGAAALWDPHSQHEKVMAEGADLLLYDLGQLRDWLLPDTHPTLAL